MKRLDKRDVQVNAAFSGAEAPDKLGNLAGAEVVILDVKMPGVDGIDTLREIRREHPLVSVVMLTGPAAVETAAEGMKLGAFDYRMKPCDMGILISKIRGAAPSPPPPQAAEACGAPREMPHPVK